uniref:RING-type domain-containing protein n=1 Tax=Callorhinchus milii TaxID=7868 RepID=A0A4W3JEG9_CALMI
MWEKGDLLKVQINQKVNMTYRHQFHCLTEELNCPICLEFFSDPVSLECGHNYCCFCITRSWAKHETYSCPECRQIITNRNLKPIVQYMWKPITVIKFIQFDSNNPLGGK